MNSAVRLLQYCQYCTLYIDLIDRRQGSSVKSLFRCEAPHQPTNEATPSFATGGFFFFGTLILEVSDPNVYRGTSLIRNRPSLAPYSRFMSRAL